ncbi:hypothetical protein V2J09_000542 [Rumex salicifolius]
MVAALVFVVVFVSPFLGCAQSDDYRYQECSSSFKCGSLEANLSYPFWSNSRPQYCGHPGFQLSCPKTTATIDTGSQTLNVLEIKMDARSMKLLWPDFTSDPCPHHLQNITLNGTALKLASDTKNVTFFYDCVSSYKGELPSFTCPKASNLSKKTAYYDVESVRKRNGACNAHVVVPMPDSAVQSMGRSTSVWGSLREGFEVGWAGLEGTCAGCLASGGACGFDWNSTREACYCRDGPNVAGICSTTASSTADESYGGDSASSSTPPSGNEVATTIPIGVGAGVFATAAVLASAAFILYRRRQNAAAAASRPRNMHPSDLENGDSFHGVNLFHYDHLEEATDYFSPSKELGEGGFGIVYHGKLGDGREVAIKRMFENSSKQVQQFMTEIQILTHLRHKNLVTLYGCTSRHSRELLLVYEYVPNGTVADHLHARTPRLFPHKNTYSPLPWSTRLSIAVETASALLYLHASDIIHRDVKTNNILLDHHYTVKVADFGLSRLFPLDLTHVSTAPQGTPGYVDPEYHQCYQLTDKSDVYSFGVVLVELISTKPAVDITRHRHEINLSNLAINKIQNDALHELVDPTLGFEVDHLVKEEVCMMAELAFQCLQPDRDTRPTMDEVYEVLARIQEHKNQSVKIKKSNYLGIIKAEVVDIPAEEALRLKSDLSPGSSSGSKGNIDGVNNTITSHSC